MPRPKVVLDYQICDPAYCQGGVCSAAQVCERKVLRQEKSGELPEITPALCLGCTDCVTVCPKNALRIIN